MLLNITHGTQEVLMDEINDITDHIQDAAGSSADVIWGYCRDESLGERLRVTAIATGFQQREPDMAGSWPSRSAKCMSSQQRTRDITTPIADPWHRPGDQMVETPAPAPRNPHQGRSPGIPGNHPARARTPWLPDAALNDTFEGGRLCWKGHPEGDEEVSSRAEDTMHPERPGRQSYDRVDPARHQANVEARQAKMREANPPFDQPGPQRSGTRACLQSRTSS